MKYPKRSQYTHAKSQYRIRNWPESEEGLQKRGDLTVWLSDAALHAWRAPPSGRPGGQRMRSRSLDSQRVEVSPACKILNTMTSLGMPDSYRAG
jgi:hypothetical protein